MAKWFKNFGKSALLGAAAGGLSSAIPGLRSVAPLVSAGAGALANKNNRLAGAAAGLAGGGAGSTLFSGLKSSFAGGAGSGLDRFSSGAGEGFRGYVGALPGFKGFGTDNPQGALARFFTSKTTAAPATAGSPTTSLPSGLSPAGMTFRGQEQSTDLWSPYAQSVRQPSFAAPAATSAVAPAAIPTTVASSPVARFNSAIVPTRRTGNVLDMFGEQMKTAAPGMLVTMAGNAFAPEVEAPDWSGITGDLRSMAMTGANPEARALGMGELQRVLQSDVSAPPENAFALGDEYAQRQLDDDLRALEQQFIAANPGSNVANNSAYLAERDKLIANNREMRSMARDAETYQYMQAQQQQRLSAMQSALGLDAQQMNYLMQLAQQDINQIMTQTGLEYGEAAQLKEMFGTLGASMISDAQNQRLLAAVQATGGAA